MLFRSYLTKGGTCEKRKKIISFKGNLKTLQFNTFEEFCSNADKILYTYTKYRKEINLMAYKEYIYSRNLDENEQLNNAMRDKCFEWIISLEYDNISKNDLYSLLDLSKKGRK